MYMRRCNINPTKDITLQRDQSLYKTGYVLILMAMILQDKFSIFHITGLPNKSLNELFLVNWLICENTK